MSSRTAEHTNYTNLYQNTKCNTVDTQTAFRCSIPTQKRGVGSFILWEERLYDEWMCILISLCE